MKTKTNRLSGWLHGERLNCLAIFLVLMICYTYFFPRWADPNQNSRLDMVVAVVDDGTFQIDPYVGNTVDYAKVGDHYYSDKAPGAAFLGIPLYGGLKLALNLPFLDSLVERLSNNSAFQSTLREGGTGILKQKVHFALAQVLLAALISALPSALLGVLIYRLGAYLTEKPAPRLAAALGYGLLTPAFAYAGAFYGHQLSAALLFAAFAIIMSGWKLLRPAVLLLTGLLLGYSVITEYPVVLIAGAVFLYAAYRLYRLGRRWEIAWVAGSGAVVAFAWMGYNTVVFGGPLELGYSYSEQWTTQHQTGFMSLTRPGWDALVGITFHPFRGLFFYAPILLLGLPGFGLWWKSGKQRAAWWVAVASILLTLLFNASSAMWWGGFAVGPRYLLPMLPFMAFSCVLVLERWGKQTWFRLLAAFLAGWSLLATWGLTLAGQAFPNDRIRNPLFEYALPRWMEGDIARNLGTILGLPGAWSLLPLVLVLLTIGVTWAVLVFRQSDPSRAGFAVL